MSEAGPEWMYKNPLEYRKAVEASPSYRDAQQREREDQARYNREMEQIVGSDYDPNGFSTY